MTVTIVRSEQESIPCGACHELLPAERPILLYLFDRFDEITDEIKTGEINLAICPACDYHGWLWPGLIVIDRGRRRGVFVVSDDLPGAAQSCEQILDAARAHVDAEVLETVRTNMVWVHTYKHIYELLCHDDAYFRVEALSDEAARRRRRIEDVDARAEQFLDDGLRIGAALMSAQEADEPFLAAVLRALDQRLAQPDLDPGVAHAFRSMRPHFAAAIEQKEPEEDPLIEPPAGVRLTAEDVATGFDLGITPELITGLEQLAGAAAEAIARDASPDPRSIRAEFVSMLRSLLHGDDGPAAADLRTLTEDAAASATGELVFGDISAADAIREASEGNDELLAAVAPMAFGSAQARPGFWLRFTRLVVHLQARRDRATVVPSFLAFASCGEFFGGNGEPLLAAGAFAAAILVISPRGGRGLRMPAAAIPILAVTSQRLGRLLHHFGDSSRALMCARNAERYFEAVHRTDGVIRSRLDAIGFAKSLPRPERAVTSGRALLEDIRKLEGDHSFEEIECLCTIGDALLASVQEAPQVMVIDLSMKREGGNEAASPEPLPLLTYPPPSPAPSEAAERPTILVARITIEGQAPYVAGIQWSGVQWLDCFVEAAAIAARARMRDEWFVIQTQIIERARTLGGPLEVPLYFHRLMLHYAKELEFGEVPASTFRSLLPALAASLSGTDAAARKELFDSPAVGRLLDEWLAQLTTEDAMSPLRGGARVHDAAGLTIGELFEAAERYGDGQRVYLDAVGVIERSLLATADTNHAAQLSELRFTGLYRAARAGLKQFFATRDPKDLRRCLDIIECYKARSVLNDPFARGEDSDADDVSCLYRLRFSQLRDVLPPSTALLVFALLPSTELNEGFWFSVLLDPEADELLHPARTAFADIYDAVEETNQALGTLRTKITNVTLDVAASEAKRDEAALEATLARLGNALVRPEIVAELEARRITRLLMVPEAYLFDVPFAALRVETSSGPVPLFRVNEGSGGLTISILPNWTSLRDLDAPTPRGGERSTPLAVALVDRPTWRPVMPLFGTRRRVIGALEQAAKWLGAEAPAKRFDATVSDFLRMLRRSHVAVFFGHGDIDPKLGAILIAHDGAVGEHEVVAGMRAGRFRCRLLVLCACSGVDSQSSLRLRRRDLAGAHVAMLRGGAGFVVGSVQPLFPIVAVRLLETLMGSIAQGADLDRALRHVYSALAADPKISSPVFWGHIVGFGNGFHRLEREDADEH